ncbi:MAG: sulfatase-like hydrolase/transferase [Verrucomicrobiales bacterium]
MKSLIFTVAAIFALAWSAAAPAAEKKPNIIYIMADELGYYELGCTGNPNILTPEIDRMAAEGVRFTQGLAGSAVCAPTRCCFLTGKHSGHTSVRVNGGGTPLRADEVTVGRALKDAGYATGGFGKWGCGGRGSTGVPEKHGFDVFVGYYDQVHAHSYYPPYIIENSKELPLEGNKGMSDGETYSHYVIYQRGIDFIKANAEAGTPFFAYLPVTPPHGIFDIPDSDPAWALYKDKDWPEDAKRYAAMVSMVDRQVGEILALVKELGIEGNTLVLFTGDNGGNDYFKSKEYPRGFHGANKDPKTGAEFRGTKGTLYEGGLRIPAIARWPGKIAPDRVSDHLWYFPDLFPTFAEIAGAKTPDDLDGISIAPELFGADAAGRAQEKHEYLYWEIGGQTAVRWGDWKGYRGKRDGAWQLYDLANDISESRDVAKAKPVIAAKIADFAEAAHTPAVEGTFSSTVEHERDRRAKFGGRAPNAKPKNGGGKPAKVHTLPKEGAIANDGWKIARASSENGGNGKLAANAIDGDPETIWHTQFQPNLKEHPHEIVIDLGKEHTIRAVRYLARQDNGWNGTVAECEVAVAAEPDGFGDPAAKATLKKTHEPQEIAFPPTKGRYVLFRALSEVTGGPWASAAEIGVAGE